MADDPSRTSVPTPSTYEVPSLWCNTRADLVAMFRFASTAPEPVAWDSLAKLTGIDVFEEPSIADGTVELRAADGTVLRRFITQDDGTVIAIDVARLEAMLARPFRLDEIHEEARPAHGVAPNDFLPIRPLPEVGR